MKYVDLHVHSTASDGTLTPAEVVERAASLSLAAIALTDHDTTNGVAEAKKKAEELKKQGTPIEVYSGVEISAAYKRRDIHIVGLFVDENNELLNRTLEATRANRENRNLRILERFEALGIHLTMEDLLNGATDTVVTRAHFGRALVNKGITSSVQEGFEKYLSEDGPCYVAREYLEPEHAIGLIKKAGGVPVLAHPLLYQLPHDELLTLLERLKSAGLQGIEVYYSANHGSDEMNVKALASYFSLAASGGSDFHGAMKPTIELGKGKGNLKVPYSVLQNLFSLKA